MPLAGYRLSTRRKTLGGTSALKFGCRRNRAAARASLGEIRALIDASPLAATVRQRAIAIFGALAQAEAKIHDDDARPRSLPRSRRRSIPSLILSALRGGSSSSASRWCGLSLRSRWATASRARSTVSFRFPHRQRRNRLSGFPLKIGDGARGLVTPTGAAVIRALARPAALPHCLEVEKIGYGAGLAGAGRSAQRVALDASASAPRSTCDEMIEVSANIDDLSPQIYDHVMNRLSWTRARDVTCSRRQ